MAAGSDNNMPRPASAKIKPETTDLERRLLAHERILKTLIAYMSRSDPRFLDHLGKAFVQPMGMARREHDFVDTDSHAEEFIRAVTLLSEAQKTHGYPFAARKRPVAPAEGGTGTSAIVAPERVRTSYRNGIWTVTVDGEFAGDYSKQEYAETAAALARLRPGAA